MKHYLFVLLALCNGAQASFLSIKTTERMTYSIASLTTLACMAYTLYDWADTSQPSPPLLTLSMLTGLYTAYAWMLQTTPTSVLRSFKTIEARYLNISHETIIEDTLDAVYQRKILRTFYQWYTTRLLGISVAHTPLHIAALIIKHDIGSLRTLERFCTEELIEELYHPIHELRSILEDYLEVLTTSPEYATEGEFLMNYLEETYFKHLLLPQSLEKILKRRILS